MLSMNSGERLAYAIDRHPGFTDRADFARAVGKRAVTVRQQINRGSVPAKDAATYARRLGVSVEWLLYGKGPDPFQRGDVNEVLVNEPQNPGGVQGQKSEGTMGNVELTKLRIKNLLAKYDIGRAAQIVDEAIEELNDEEAGRSASHPRKRA